MSTSNTQNETTQTTAAAHTPGPWITETNEAGTIVSVLPSSNEGFEVAAVKLYTIRLGVKNTPDNDERRANARLIAAAPELLAVAREVLAHLPCPQSRADVELEKRLEAVIAKATGGNA
jgi:hypothetical protein